MGSRRALAAMVVAVIIVAAFGAGALAQVAPQDESPQEIDLDGVVVTSGTYQEAVAELEAAGAALTAAQRTIASGELAIPDLLVAIDRIGAAIPRLRSQLAAAADIERDARADLHALVAIRYALDVGNDAGLSAFSEPQVYIDDRRLATLLGAAQSHRHRTYLAAGNVREDAGLQLEAATAGVGQVRATLDRYRNETGLAMADAERIDQELGALEEAASVARRLGAVQGSDLTFVALEAYVSAAVTSRREDPGCGLDWTTLAGIGRIESGHGTYGDRELGVTGITDEDITGIPLDGTRNTREIRDTDGGLLDGDPVYDRAVGPMQFIPTTWARWSRDGDGDGTADPHNLYDAAASAAAYLCAAADFQSMDGTRRALLAYNRSDEYVDAVLVARDGYRALGIVTE